MSKRKTYISKSRQMSGFTIVELLVAILIIGILSSVLALTYSGIQQKQRNNTRISDIKLIQSHLETYFAQNGVYPNLADMNSNTWILANLKGLSPADVRDPLAKSSAPSFSTVLEKGEFTYQPASSDGGSPCDNKTVACLDYTLSATLEGNPPTFVAKSLN